MGITIEAANLPQIERRLGGMRQKAPKVLKFAVNDTARKAKARLTKEAQKEYAVKGVGINKQTRIKFGTDGNPVATLYARGAPIPLYRFKFRRGTMGSGRYYNPTLHRYQTGKGGSPVRAQQLKNSSMKPEQLGNRKAFIASAGSGHTGIFMRRAGKKRGDKRELRELMGSSIPEMFGNEKRVYGAVEPHIKSDLKEAVNRHVARVFMGQL